MVLKPSELSENMAQLLVTIIPQYLDKVHLWKAGGAVTPCGLGP